MIQASNIPVSLDALLPGNKGLFRKEVARALGMKATALGEVRLLKRSIDKKTLEKLKAKQAEQYAQDERLREQKQFDETASLRFKVSRY